MTMVFDPLSLFLPHYCCSCGLIGAVLCESCYYDIISEPEQRCLSCWRPLLLSTGCRCQRSFSRSWYVGQHKDKLRSLVAVSKFEASRAGCDKQAELLDEVLPELPDSLIVAPVPTIARHVRQRGFAHAERIARRLANKRQLACQSVFARTEQLVQHGASKTMRARQAGRSFRLTKPIDTSKTYLIVDDVYTTGATINALAKLLITAGLEQSQIWVAVTARQPGH